jgi:hypothetical protein
MALYAFDGTWNSDEEAPVQDTNVVRFQELYSGSDVEYCEGVGTRWGSVGRVLGGLLGSGGRTRIDEMYDDLCENWGDGDRDIDIIGFSRGAALALHFANKIADEGVKLEKGASEPAKIRFLGLWDVVASFGLSFNNVLKFQEINLGWDVNNVAECVDHCFHAMALDERRETFGVTRLNEKHDLDNVQELWFRGVHSDVGGGNENAGRSNIALNWMLDRAIECGVPINSAKRKKDKYSTIDDAARISENKDVKRDKRRKRLDGDKEHPSANARKLQVGESNTSTVYSESKYNWSGVELETGCHYEFIIDSGQRWKDGDLETCGPGGWKSEQLPWYQEKIVGWLEKNRRRPDADWFEIIATLGDEDDELLRILHGDKTYTANHNADLYYFANDLQSKYDNNSGSIEVTVKRTL